MEISILWVVVAGLTEPIWVIAMKKYSETRNILFIGVILAFLIFDPTAVALAEGGGVPPSIAFAVWVSIGTVMTTITGYLLFEDRLDFLRVLFIAMILVGVIGLQLAGV